MCNPLWTLFPCANWCFFSFLSEGDQETAKISHFVDFDRENASKWLEWYIFRVQGMPNPMALLASLYNMWFMKIHNCWWHIAENGVQNIWKWDGTYAAVLLGAHFTPTPCYRTLYLDLPIKMQKNHNNTKSSHIVHYDRHTQKPICTDLEAFANTFSLGKLTFFSVFCQGEFRKQPKCHILLILTGKNASKWLEWHIFRLQGMPNPMPQVLHLCNKQFLKNHNFRQKIHILLILTGKNASKLFEWHIFRVQGMPNPMALLASLYNMWFMKNHNFWWHIVENGVQNHENGMGQMQQSS